MVTQTCKQLGGAARLAGSLELVGRGAGKDGNSRPHLQPPRPRPDPSDFSPWHRSLPSQLQEGDLRKSQSGLTARMGQRAEFSVKSGRIRSEALHSVQADWECWASLAHFPPPLRSPVVSVSLQTAEMCHWDPGPNSTHH